MPEPRRALFRITALRLAVVYLLLAGWWFFASDNLLVLLVPDPARLTDLQLYKIWLFLGMTAALLFVLSREALGPRAAPAPAPAAEAPAPRVSAAVPAVALGLLVAAVAASWHYAHQDQRERIRAEKQRDLLEIASLQAAQLGYWIGQRRIEAEIVARDPLLAGEVARWLGRGAPDDGSRLLLVRRLRGLLKAYDYEEILLLDRAGAIRLALTESNPNMSRYDSEFAQRALRENRVLLSDLHRHEEAGSAGIEVDIMAPLAASGGTAFAAVYFRIDPGRFIYPAIAPRPGAPATQETLLVRAEGDDVVYLSEPRLRATGGAARHAPLAGAGVAALVLAAGREGVFEANDQRGVPVLAAARRIEHSDWFVITKVDAEAVYAPMRRHAWLLAVLALVFLAIAGGTLGLWWWQQRSLYHARELRAELARREAQALLRQRETQLAALFEHAGDAIFVHDRAGRIEDLNAQACASLGYAREELIGRSLADIDPDHRPGAAPWDGLTPGTIATVSGRHRRRDGSTFPVELRLTVVETPQGERILADARDMTERREGESRLAASEQKWRSYIENAPDAVLVTDASGRFLEANPAACALFGFGRDELLARNLADLTRPDPENQEAARRHFQRVVETGQSTGEIGAVARDGRRLAVDVSAVALGQDRYLGFLRDVTAQRQVEDALRLYARVFEAGGEAIVVTDAKNCIVSVNRAFTQITGYEGDEVIGRNPRLLSSGRHDPAFYQQLWATLNETGNWKGELWNRRKNGEVYPEWANISAIRNDRGTVTHYIAIFSDITERKASEEKISFLAQHDTLTNLPNRALMQDRLRQAILAAQRSREQIALLFVDLDRFKQINDSLGHHVGDLLLQAVAERLARCVRRGDTVSRVGGDEFVLILPNLRDAAAAAGIAEKAVAALAQPYQLVGRELVVTSSIGIAVFPHDGADGEALLKSADAAMYHAKQAGRNNYQFFTADMNARAFERMLMESNLRRALERGQFALWYQPQVELASGRIVGLEALLRWNHPEVGWVAPSHFVPVAEECGLIVAIGDQVLRRAAAQAAEWRGAGLPALPIAVNLSALHFRQAGFPEKLAELLKETGLPPALLELEVTESTLMDDAASTVALVQGLAEAGLSIVVDDFGTGYSSLSYLKRFRIHKLKIDQSFVRHLPQDAEDAAIIRSIIGVGKSLRLRVVAEGVETREQLEFLRAAGCDDVQGFLLGKPLPPEALTERLRQGLATGF